MKRMRFVAITALFFVTLACGGGSDEHVATAGQQPAAPSADTQARASDREVTAPPSASEPPFAFTTADLDLYERGMAAEIAVVKAAQQRATSASSPAERGAAMQAQWEDQSIPAAAKAAGIDEARYEATRHAVHYVLETLDFQGKIDGPKSMDMSRASEAMKARLSKDAFDALTREAADALRPRLDRIAAQWAEYARLTAVAG